MFRKLNPKIIYDFSNRIKRVVVICFLTLFGVNLCSHSDLHCVSCVHSSAYVLCQFEFMPIIIETSLYHTGHICIQPTQVG